MMKEKANMTSNAQNEFRQFAWNLASSISKVSTAKSQVSKTRTPARTAVPKRVRAK